MPNLAQPDRRRQVPRASFPQRLVIERLRAQAAGSISAARRRRLLHLAEMLELHVLRAIELEERADRE